MKGSTAVALLGVFGLVGGLVARRIAVRDPYVGLGTAPREALYPGELRVTTLRSIGADSIRIGFANLHPTDSLVRHGRPESVGLRRSSSEYVVAVTDDTTRVELLASDRPASAHLAFVRVPSREYIRSGRNAAASGTVSLVSSDLPVGASDGSSVDDWVPPPDPGVLPAALARFVGVTPRRATTWARLQPLAEGYSAWLAGRVGIPSDSAQGLGPTETLRWLARPDSRGWCYNLSKGFLALSAYSDLRARIVALHVPEYGDVSLGNHATTEVYDSEWRRWRLVDFTLGILSVVDSTGAPLDASRLHDALRTGEAPTHLRFLRFSQDRTRPPSTWDELPAVLRSQLRYEFGPWQRVSVVRWPAVSGDVAPPTIADRLLATQSRFVLVESPPGSVILTSAVLRRIGTLGTVIGGLLIAFACLAILAQTHRSRTETPPLNGVRA